MAALALLSFIDYTFTYPEGERPALDRISFSLDRGEILLLCGPTGSGKTTLLRSMKAETVPAGQEKGEVRVGGRLRSGGMPENFTVGYVAQDPANQMVMDTVWHELAFGLENLGLPSPVIRRRMAETANFFGIEDWIEKKVSALSGGQKQLLNLASVLAMQPDLLLLDEPTAQLDPIASKEFLQMVRRINRELGITVVLSEHRLEDALPMADQVAYLEEGTLCHFCPPAEFVRRLYQSGSGFVSALPAAVRIAHSLGGDLPRYPLSVREGRTWLEEAGIPFHNGAAVQTPSKADKVLWARDLWYRYDRAAPFVIRDGELQVRRGEIYTIVGGNGSGKTTLLLLLSGVCRPSRGRVWRDPHSSVGLLSQNPKSLFTADTLREEMMELSASHGYGETEAAAMLERLGLSHMTERHPYDLSGGEMQKAAMAKILLLSPHILLLDEPTKGLDAAAREELRRILLQLRAEGRTLLLVTHDLDFAASVSDRCSMLFDGGILSTDTGKHFFAANLFYTTETNRMTRNLSPRQPDVFTQACVTAEDVVSGPGAGENVQSWPEKGGTDRSDRPISQLYGENKGKSKRIRHPDGRMLRIVPKRRWSRDGRANR